MCALRREKKRSMFSFTGGALEGMQVDAASKQEASGGRKTLSNFPDSNVLIEGLFSDI